MNSPTSVVSRPERAGLALASQCRGGLTRLQRRSLIAAGRRLPPAVRVPTELSLWWHVKQTLDVKEHLQAALTYREEHAPRMAAFAESVIGQLLPLHPKIKHQRMLKRVVNAVLIGKNPDDFYGLQRVAERCGRMDYDECCARSVPRNYAYTHALNTL